MKKKKLIKLVKDTMRRLHKTLFELTETKKELARVKDKDVFCGEVDEHTKSKCYLTPNHEGEHIGYSKVLADNIYWNTEKPLAYCPNEILNAANPIRPARCRLWPGHDGNCETKEQGE